MEGTKALEELRPFVLAARTTVEWRIDQLEKLRLLLIDEKEAMISALAADLGVDENQAVLFQIASIFGEIDICIDEVAEWSKPRKVPTPALLLPASSYVQAQPKGVVLVMGAWNYPFNVTIGPVASALAAGNCVVVKPSELAPESAKVMHRIFGKLDQRAVRCCLGGPDVSSAISSQPFDHIVYTGGPRVAKLILAAAAPNLTPVTLELGGKSPVIICQGANLHETCQRIATFKFVNAGQTCIAPDYILVEKRIQAEVTTKLVEAVKKMFSGSPQTAQHYSRLVNPQSLERLKSALSETHGGKVLIGGLEQTTDNIKNADRFLQPTIVLDPKPGSALLEMELFGPILPIITVDSVNEAISYVNAHAKPLALYVFAPAAVAERVLAQTSSGGAIVGDCMLHKGNPHLPFGGIGGSGMGRLHGLHGFRELSNERAVMYRPLWAPSLVSLPVPSALAQVSFAYSTWRPGRFVRQHVLKFIAFVAAIFVLRARQRTHRVK